MSGSEKGGSEKSDARPSPSEEPDAAAPTNPFGGSISERLAEAMSELEVLQEGVAKAEADLRETTFTARSRDRLVEVTVGPQGQLVGLRFLDGRYRTASATELAASVLEAAAQGRDAMARHVMQTLKPFTDPGPDLPGVTGFDVDWGAIFGPQVLEEDPDAGPRAARSARSRLRDEISEDAEE